MSAKTRKEIERRVAAGIRECKKHKRPMVLTHRVNCSGDFMTLDSKGLIKGVHYRVYQGATYSSSDKHKVLVYVPIISKSRGR